MSNSILALLRRYQRGICTEQERLIVEQWLEQHATDELPVSNDVIDEYLRLNKLMTDRRLQKKRAVSQIRWTQAAAIAVLALGVVVLLYLKQIKINERQTAVYSPNNITKQLKNGWWYINTPKGKSAIYTLSDGSAIILNAGSSIRFPEKFAFNKRPVYLDEGEALFKVAKDKLRPFTVYTPGFSTTALGTEFNIRAYTREHTIAVALLHGKVLVRDIRKTTAPKLHILLPHQQLVVPSLNGQVIQSAFNNEKEITGWQHGQLSFKDATAAEIINSIENKFNVTIINKSQKENWSYTGTFNKEALPDILKTISLTEGINYTIHNQTVTFY
ncbi:FecR family protein [Mucilaginibacter sp.]